MVATMATIGNDVIFDYIPTFLLIRILHWNGPRVKPCYEAYLTIPLGPVLLVRHDAVARILANGSAAFFESCAAPGWKDCDNTSSL